MEIIIVDPGIPRARFNFNHYGGTIDVPDGYGSKIVFQFPTRARQPKKGEPLWKRSGFDAEMADERLVNFVRELAKGIGFELKPVKNFRR